MASPNSWLLIDVLDARDPAVVAVGTRVKSRVSLRSFIRTSDRDAVLAVVTRALRSGRSVRVRSGSRSISADPVSDDVTGLVHGVWLQVAHHAGAVFERPSAWAFAWNLNTGVARRSDIVSETQSWSSLGIDKCRPIPDGLAKLDLGTATASVLARLISGGAGTVVQEVGVERRPSGDHRKIQFTAHFFSGTGSVDTSETNTMVRGLSVDLGASDSPDHADRQKANLGDLVAESLADPDEYRAIVNPDTLRLLYWYGNPPNRICWQTAHTADSKPILHPGDRQIASKTARSLKSAPPGTTRTLSLRFLTHTDTYADVAVIARAIDLDDRSRAILLILRTQGTSFDALPGPADLGCTPVRSASNPSTLL